MKTKQDNCSAWVRSKASAFFFTIIFSFYVFFSAFLVFPKTQPQAKKKQAHRNNKHKNAFFLCRFLFLYVFGGFFVFLSNNKKNGKQPTWKCIFFFSFYTLVKGDWSGRVANFLVFLVFLFFDPFDRFRIICGSKLACGRIQTGESLRVWTEAGIRIWLTGTCAGRNAGDYIWMATWIKWKAWRKAGRRIGKKETGDGVEIATWAGMKAGRRLQGRCRHLVRTREIARVHIIER